jgi:hypothetical protein
MLGGGHWEESHLKSAWERKKISEIPFPTQEKILGSHSFVESW